MSDVEGRGRLDLLEQLEHARSAIDAQAQVTLAALAGDGMRITGPMSWCVPPF